MRPSGVFATAWRRIPAVLALGLRTSFQPTTKFQIFRGFVGTCGIEPQTPTVSR
jgi:hypothetical protein